MSSDPDLGAAPGLSAFSVPTQAWFREVFAAPTLAQDGAWRAIAAGQNALVVAPTGSGKTLAAFLSALDRLAAAPVPPAKERCRVLYVSPLKALAVDIERNLRAPLAGISRTAVRLGQPAPDITVGVRSGDTTTADRRKLATRPPDILITTPESLFLMLTSAARESLMFVDTVIIDEVHALAGSKRGAHLALSLERLDALAAGNGRTAAAQRIGLSATVRPPERVARYLGGARPVSIVAPAAEKLWDLEIVVPVEDMSDLRSSAPPPGGPVAGGEPGDPFALAPPTPSIWPHLEARILAVINAHRSTIVFVNSRRLAERLTAHLNELQAQQLVPQPDDQDVNRPEGALTAARGSTGPPAQIMAQSGASAGLDASLAPVVARAHHGSVSKEQRARIEDDLKSGVLPCVVATSSLELGIDMGAVDVVVQVESPPSVASGLQRVGRAGHQVGATSRGVFFPNHRGDLIETAVVVERMRLGAIEEVAELRNPLDVLAQQVVAITAMDDQDVEQLFGLVRRASNFADLPRSAFDAVLDMLSGRYPSEDFAELRPRLIWQRETGTLSARPGAQRLAVTSGGTIPDRGLFGVFLVGEGNAAGRHSPGRRVGELDEEMVYESRVGDVFTLGTTSWRIEDITHDQVLVSPAPGIPGRLPFWKGDSPGRPAELGRAFGAFVRELAALPEEQATARLAAAGLDAWAAANLISYLFEQLRATQALPTDQTIVFERFRDELGDWQVCVHSPLGSGVMAPWALAIERAARQRYGMEVQATATNDGIVLRIPDTESEPPSADLIIGDPDELEQIVVDEVGSSALFASRFRECAARALLLPRRDPRSRSPLWQQRMRSAQLLAVAVQYPEFPMVLETMRECLTDVFDLDGLLELQRRLAARRIQVVEVETTSPSPFAKSLLFGYVGAFVYEGDVPLAEKRAAALSLDATLLAELLGKDGLKQLLDPHVIAATEADLQGLSAERRAGTIEQLFDLLRMAGPFSADEIRSRCSDALDPRVAVADLVAARRVVEVRIAGQDFLAVTEDIALLRDGLGIPVPPGAAANFAAPVDKPVEALALRWARSHGPFELHSVAARYGLGHSVIVAAAQELTRRGTLVAGTFTEERDEHRPGTDQYCHARVLALIKRRSLAALRKEVEPIEQVAFGRFLPQWQGVASGARGTDALLAMIEQLAGYPMPASMIETIILPSRVTDYSPTMLDQLTSAGEVSWLGDGAIGESDGWLRFLLPGMEPPPPRADPASFRGRELLERMAPGGAWFFETLLAEVTEVITAGSRADYVAALWDLVWSGHITADTLAPIRALTVGGAVRHPRQPGSRRHASGLHTSRLAAARLARPRTPGRLSSPTTAGRWGQVIRTNQSASSRFTSDLFAALDRYGVLTRGSVLTEEGQGGFGAAYRALSALEESGQCRRGYFIEGLGAAQFALAGAVDRLRSQPTERSGGNKLGDDPEGRALVLAACDPANPYGAALPWPEREGHRPGRKAGALVVLVDGALVLYVERGGKTLLSFSADQALLTPAAAALARSVAAGQLGKVTIERADGGHVFAAAEVSRALQAAGFRMTPQGLRLRPSS